MRKRRRQLVSVEQRQAFRALAPCSSTRLAAHVLGSGADQAVPGHEMMIEKGQRLVGSKRREPQRQTRELDGHRIQIDAEEAARRNLAPEGHSIGGGDVVGMPPPFPDERVFSSRRQMAACRDEEGTAPHRRIENAKTQDLVIPSPDEERLEGAANQECRYRARRVEGAARFADVARSNEAGTPAPRRWSNGRRLVVKHSLVHRSE